MLSLTVLRGEASGSPLTRIVLCLCPWTQYNTRKRLTHKALCISVFARGHLYKEPCATAVYHIGILLCCTVYDVTLARITRLYCTMSLPVDTVQ